MECETIRAEPVKYSTIQVQTRAWIGIVSPPPVCRDQLLINFRFDLKDRQIPQALPGLRLAGPAHRLPREWNQILREVPNGGKLLTDRSLSKLLKADWPRTVEEMEDVRSAKLRR